MNTKLIQKVNQYITDNGSGRITGPVLNQVLRDMITGSVAEVTYSELSALIAAKHISPGTVYKITDRGDRGIFTTGVTDKMISRDGVRIMLCPKTYLSETLDGNKWEGVWHASGTASINDLFIWGARVWKNLTGEIGAALNDFQLDNTNWAPVDKTGFTNKEYVEVPILVRYDFENDWIEYQYMPGRMSAGVPWSLGQGFDGINFIDYTDWNDNSTIIRNVNVILGVMNNCQCGTLVNIKCWALGRNYQTKIQEATISSYTYFDNEDISGMIRNNHCKAIFNVCYRGIIDGINHPDGLFNDHTDDGSFYFEYNLVPQVDDIYPSGPIDAGDFRYTNMVLRQGVLLTEVVAIGSGLTGEPAAKISIGLETDDETYIEEAALADLNNGIKINTLGNKTTAPFRRFKIQVVDGDVTGGLLKVYGKYL